MEQGMVEPMSVIERVMQWVFAEQRCRMPWSVDRTLAFNQGLTARPRKASESGWATSEMCAGVAKGKTRMRLAVPTHPEAEIVLECVKRLPARSAALIITHGRNHSRPDEMLGVEARLRPVFVVRKVKGIETQLPKVVGRDRYGHYGVCELEWDVSPTKIANAREDGRLWRAALRRIAAELDGLTIGGWSIEAQRQTDLPPFVVSGKWQDPDPPFLMPRSHPYGIEAFQIIDRDRLLIFPCKEAATAWEKQKATA